MLKQVEVKNGSSSVLYGGGGIGGTILLTTKDAKDLLREGETVGGSYKFGVRTNAQETSNVLSFYTQQDDVGFLVQGIYRNSNNLTTTNPGYNHVNRNGESFGVLAKVSYTPTEEQYLSLTYTYDDSSVEGEPKSSLDSNNRQNRIVGNYELALNEYVNLKAVAQGAFRDYAYKNSTVDQSDEFSSYGLSLQNSTRLWGETDYANTVTYGVDSYFDRQKGYANGAVTDERPHAKSQDFGMFAQDSVSIMDIFEIIPAARFTYYSRKSERGLADDMSDTKVTPSITLQATPVEWLNVFVSYAGAYRPPSMDELYTYISYGAAGDVVPNPNLKPEESRTVEAGFSINKEALFAEEDAFGFKFVYFDQRVKDMIATYVEWGANPGDPFKGTFINVNRGTRNGVEMVASYSYAGADVMLSYGKTIGRDQDSGARQGGSPGKFAARFAYAIPDAEITPFYKFRYVEKFEDSGTSYNSYSVHSLGLTWTPKIWESVDGYLTVSMDNVFDKRYRSAFGGYELGRGVNMTVGVQF